MAFYYGTSGNDSLSAYNDKFSATMRGYRGNDRLSGSRYGDRIYGYSGNDSLYGNSGDDKMYGGSGNDFLKGGLGNDTMYGGTGNDTYTVNSSKDKVIEYSGQGADTVRSSVSYTLGTYLENLTLYRSAYRGYGNSYGNTIKGNDSRNFLSGRGGNDKLYGYAGDDTLIGGSGNDYVSGGSGRDFLTGGTGNDTLVGGSGSDTLQGYGGTTREYDTLSGEYPSDKPGRYDFKDGGDRFVLGNSRSAFYEGLGYATITDFNRGEGDKIQLHGRRSDYSLGSSRTTKGTSALDTTIRYKGDLIGIVQDTTAVSLYSDVEFV